VSSAKQEIAGGGDDGRGANTDSSHFVGPNVVLVIGKCAIRGHKND
jgi:hypothetical protein